MIHYCFDTNASSAVATENSTYTIGFNWRFTTNFVFEATTRFVSKISGTKVDEPIRHYSFVGFVRFIRVINTACRLRCIVPNSHSIVQHRYRRTRLFLKWVENDVGFLGSKVTNIMIIAGKQKQMNNCCV